MIGKEEIVDKNTKHLYKGLSIKRPWKLETKMKFHHLEFAFLLLNHIFYWFYQVFFETFWYGNNQIQFIYVQLKAFIKWKILCILKLSVLLFLK